MSKILTMPSIGFSEIGPWSIWNAWSKMQRGLHNELVEILIFGEAIRISRFVENFRNKNNFSLWCLVFKTKVWHFGFRYSLSCLRQLWVLYRLTSYPISDSNATDSVLKGYPNQTFTVPVCLCKRPHLCLIQLTEGTNRRRIPLQHEDHSGNDPHLVRGFPRLYSGMFPDRFWIVSVLVGSREIRLV